MSNYPLGAKDDPRAPWNEKETRMVDVEVEAVLIISRNITVSVPEDYCNADVHAAICNETTTKNSMLDKAREWNVEDIDWEIV